MSARGRRAPLVLLAVAVGAVVVVGSLLTGGTSEAPLDPDNPARDGAQALARVLEDRGTPVTVVRDQSELLEADVAGATVAVTGVGDLSPTTTGALREHASGAAALVVGGSAVDLVTGFEPDLELDERDAGERAASCAEPLVEDLVVETDEQPGLVDPPTGATLCFGDPGVLLRAGSTWVLSAPDVLANGTVTDADNAALALRLLEQGDHVVWYVPDPADVPAEDATGLGAFLPPWLVPGLGLLAVAAAAALVWRGRRLGPLALEPLPVVVRAAESTHARGRMYHRTRDRAHAAGVLRGASRARLAHALRLPGDATPADVAGAAAAGTGRDAHDLHRLLTDPPPTSDAALADLGRRLRSLEDEVHRP